MNRTVNLEVLGQRATYRPAGKMTFEQAVELVAVAMEQARAQGCTSLLANFLGVTGIAPPSIFARHALAVKWAESAGTHLRVALVVRAELIDPEKIGVLMAQNRGVSGDVFTHEAAALAWLDSRPDGTLKR